MLFCFYLNPPIQNIIDLKKKKLFMHYLILIKAESCISVHYKIYKYVQYDVRFYLTIFILLFYNYCAEGHLVVLFTIFVQKLYF